MNAEYPAQPTSINAGTTPTFRPVRWQKAVRAGLLSISLTIGICSTQTGAAPLVEGATVDQVQISWFGNELIGLKLNGGSGPCAGQAVIFLSKGNFTSYADNFDRSYSLAMTALATGKTIDIHGADGDCNSGTVVAINR